MKFYLWVWLLSSTNSNWVLEARHEVGPLHMCKRMAETVHMNTNTNGDGEAMVLVYCAPEGEKRRALKEMLNKIE